MSVIRYFRRSRWDDERARELDAHLAIETDENIARGMSPDCSTAPGAISATVRGCFG
jgi:hypothetical protein